jgi:regulator of sigma E protease
MSQVLNFLLYSALPFIFALGILVFIHELGHFLLAKLVGIRVERFSIGYPPRMFGKKVGDTDYCVSWVPLGGYVKLSGMIDESLDEASIKGEPWEFMSKPVYQRFLVILAGPVMNILLAIILIAGFAFFVGFGELIDKPIIGDVFEGKPAHTAGLRTGDEILSINGQEMASWNDIVESIHGNAENTPVEIVWRSGDSTITRQITPQFDETSRSSLIGIGPSILMQKFDLVRSIGYGFTTTVKVTTEIFNVIGRLISRETKLKDSIAGPVSIFNMIGQSAKQGWENYLMLIALISLNLGIFNLLPIPVLDGGHLVYLTIETIIRRPIPVKTKMIIQQIGIALLLILMVLVTINDIRR